MLSDQDIKKDKEVRVNEEGEYNGKVGVITYYELKMGYKKCYPFYNVTVKFEDNEERVFRSWLLISNDFVAETEEPVVEVVTETSAEPVTKKRKPRQAAKRFNLTNALTEDNILTVQTGLIHNTFEEIDMSDTNSAVALTDSTDTATPAVAAVKTPQKRGRKPDPNSKINRAAAFLAALPADQLTKSVAVPLLMKELDLTEEVAQVYFYNKRPASARKVRTPKAAKTAPVAADAADTVTTDTTGDASAE